MNIVSLGLDSEFFLFDKDDNFVPAYRVTKGNKDEPEVIMQKGDFYVAVHWDNVALEVTASPLDITYGLDLELKIFKYLSKIHNILIDWANLNECKISYEPFIHISKDVMYDRESNIFGCEPDYNIYTGLPNPSPSAMKAKTLRTAGSHFHFGIEVVTDFVVQRLIKTFDSTIYEMMTSFCKEDVIKDIERRKLYGQAGSFRVKDYGIECRVCSPLVWKNLNKLSRALSRVILVNDKVVFNIDDIPNTNAIAILLNKGSSELTDSSDVIGDSSLI